VVGREGVSESMKDVAIMAARGAEHIAVAHVDGIYGHNSREKAAELAEPCRPGNAGVNMVYFLASGIDIDDDACIAGIESVFGPDVTIFGATSADNMKGIASYQMVDDHRLRARRLCGRLLGPDAGGGHPGHARLRRGR
jgi:hypothetical protein